MATNLGVERPANQATAVSASDPAARLQRPHDQHDDDDRREHRHDPEQEPEGRSLGAERCEEALQRM
jgi:hypothetical protein